MGLECLFFYHAIPSTVRNLYILDEIMNEEKGKKWRESLLEVKEVAERQEIEEIDFSRATRYLTLSFLISYP